MQTQHYIALLTTALDRTVTCLADTDPSDADRCYRMIENTFQYIRLIDFYTELGEVQQSNSQLSEPSNLTVLPPMQEQPLEGQVNFDEVVSPATDETPKGAKTKDDVKAILTQLATAKKGVKGLLSKYGADRFTSINESDYDAIYADAELLLRGE